MKGNILHKQNFQFSIWSLLLFLMGAGSPVFAVDGEYLADFDLLWNRTPKAYEESAFLGNGELGTCIWSARDEALHFDIGDTRVYSEKSRAPIGKFILKTKGEASGFSMRLDLHTAMASGMVATSKGKVDFKSLASVKQDVVLVEFTVTGDEEIVIEHFALPGAPADGLYAIRKDKSVHLDNPNDFSDPITYQAIMGMELVKQLAPEERGEVDGIQIRYVPLKGGQRGRSIDKIEIDNTVPWRGKHLRAFQYNYRTSPYFEAFEDRFEAFFERDWETLGSVSVASSRLVCEILDLPEPTTLTEGTGPAPDSQELILESDRPVAGARILQFKPKGYPQNFAGFEPGMSVLDAVFNIGFETLDLLRQNVLIVT